MCFGLMDESFIVLSNSYVKRKKRMTPLGSTSQESGDHLRSLVTRVVRAILVQARLNGLTSAIRIRSAGRLHHGGGELLIHRYINEIEPGQKNDYRSAFAQHNSPTMASSSMAQSSEAPRPRCCGGGCGAGCGHRYAARGRAWPGRRRASYALRTIHHPVISSMPARKWAFSS